MALEIFTVHWNICRGCPKKEKPLSDENRPLREFCVSQPLHPRKEHPMSFGRYLVLLALHLGLVALLGIGLGLHLLGFLFLLLLFWIFVAHISF